MLNFSRRSADEAAAIELCHECAVEDLCYTYAMDEEIEFGVWGGMAARNRKPLIRVRQLARLRGE